MKTICLIPAYNEEQSIGATIEALLTQTRVPDEIIVIPNGCTDKTAWVARMYPVTVLELPTLTHRKSEALNTAWAMYGQDADIVICHDADTVLPPNAVADWETEFKADQLFGGSTAKFTVVQKGFLGRLQKAEYAGSIQIALDKGYATVLAGAGSAFSAEALRVVAARSDREGPWTYESDVEDYELTYRLRQAGLHTVVSPTVRAYTDGMATVSALWNQRIKWQTGTLDDMLRFGWNRITRAEWMTQVFTLLSPILRLLIIALTITALSLGSLSVSWWAVFFPLLGLVVSLRAVLRVPHRDWKDVLIALSILPLEFLECLHGGWLLVSWAEVIKQRLTNTKRDLWAAQYKAEGV